MKTTLSFKSIAPFLDAPGNTSRIFSFAGLLVGVLLLLCAAQMFVNINSLLKERNPRRDGYDFISITKTITNQNMGSDNRFTDDEIVDLKKQSFITDAAPLLSNQFRAKASAGSVIPFSTELFLESIQEDFLDTIPPGFSWQPGQQVIPVIFSADFLEMYNVFAPAQGLPQISASSLSTVQVTLECYGASGMRAFRSQVVGISDRINSVLVPRNFLEWANKEFGNVTKSPPARVFIKTSDANNPAFLQYLQEKNFHINKDKTKFGRIKQVLQAVVSGLAGFAVLVIVMALMLFSFYLQLMIARSRENIRLLLLLGYSPRWLGGTVTKKWIPVYIIIILVALALAGLAQYLFHRNFLQLSPWLDPVVLGIGFGLMILCIATSFTIIRKLIRNVS